MCDLINITEMKLPVEPQQRFSPREKMQYLYPSGSRLFGTDTAAVTVVGKPLQDARILMAGPRLDAAGKSNENCQIDPLIRLSQCLIFCCRCVKVLQSVCFHKYLQDLCPLGVYRSQWSNKMLSLQPPRTTQTDQIKIPAACRATRFRNVQMFILGFVPHVGLGVNWQEYFCTTPPENEQILCSSLQGRNNMRAESPILHLRWSVGQDTRKEEWQESIRGLVYKITIKTFFVTFRL